MSSALAGPLAGSVRWAVVPYVPRPPFRLYAGVGSESISVPDPETIIAAAKRGEATLTYLVESKTRPILILNEAPLIGPPEVTALRLLRLSKLSPEEQDRVRRQDDRLLFHLTPRRFELPEENAAIVSSLVRVHVEAIAGGDALGRLDANEMRALGERIITFYGFDTRLLLERQIREIVARRREREARE